MPPKSSQAAHRIASSLPESDAEVACPLRNRDGTACRKRCLGDKRYRSMQEHIRRAHPEYYIPKLPATESSFLLMVRSPPGEHPQSRLQPKTESHAGVSDESDQTAIENNDAVASPLALFEDVPSVPSDPARAPVSNLSDPGPAFGSDFTPFTSELPPATTPGLTNSVESLVEEAAWSASTPFVANYSDWTAAGDWNRQFYPENSLGVKHALDTSPAAPGVGIGVNSSPSVDRMFVMSSDDSAETTKPQVIAGPESRHLPRDGGGDMFGAEPVLPPPSRGTVSVNEQHDRGLVHESNKKVDNWLTRRHADSSTEASQVPAKFRVKTESLAVRDIPLGSQTGNAPKLARRNHPEQEVVELASGDAQLFSDSPVRFGIPDSTLRQPLDASQAAAVQKFETMCAEQQESTSAAASWGARRQSAPGHFDASLSRNSFLSGFGQADEPCHQVFLKPSSTLPRRFFQRLKRLRSNSDDDVSKDPPLCTHADDREMKPHKRSKSCREVTSAIPCDKISQSFITNTLINGEPYPYVDADHASIVGIDTQGSALDVADAGRLGEEGYFTDTWYPIACVARAQPPEVVPDGLGVEWIQTELTTEASPSKNEWPSASQNEDVSPKSAPLDREDQTLSSSLTAETTKQSNPEATTNASALDTEGMVDAVETGVQVNTEQGGGNSDAPSSELHERTSPNGVRGSVGSATTMVEASPAEATGAETAASYPISSVGSTLRQVGLAKIRLELSSLADQYRHLDCRRERQEMNAGDALGHPSGEHGSENSRNSLSDSRKGEPFHNSNSECRASRSHLPDSGMQEDGERPGRHLAQNSLELRTTPYSLRFACPYQAHELSKSCLRREPLNAEGGCTGINQLRQHLSHRHSRSFRCQQCWKSFDARHQVEEHEKQQPACKSRPMPSGEVFMDGETEKELEKVVSSGSEEETWWDIFRLLIPGMKDRDACSLKAEYWPYYVHIDFPYMVPSITISNASFKEAHVVNSTAQLPPTSTDEARLPESKSSMTLPASSISKLMSQTISVPLFEVVADQPPAGAASSSRGGTAEPISALQSPSYVGINSPTPLSTASTLYNWSNQQSLNSPLSDQILLQKSYERLKTRSSRAEAESAEFREASQKSCHDLSRVDAILEGVRACTVLPAGMPEKLLQISEILASVKSRLG